MVSLHGVPAVLAAALSPRIKAGAEEDPQAEAWGPRDLHHQVEAGAEEMALVEAATAATMAEKKPTRCGLPLLAPGPRPRRAPPPGHASRACGPRELQPRICP